MRVIENIESIIISIKEVGYWEIAIPSEVDFEILKNIDYYGKLTLSEKEKVKCGITIEMAWYLLAFSERMATFSLRSNEQNIFNNGLYALDAIGDKLDSREILLVITLYYDVSKKNSFSFDMVKREKNEFKEMLQSYLNRKEEDKSLKSMGYIIETNEHNQLIYKRTW